MRGARQGRRSAPSRHPGEFQVQEFRVPLMKAVLRPPAAPLIAVTEFPSTSSVQYLAGGGAAELARRAPRAGASASA